LAGLKRGERVLIHAATGGVGLAAVQLAQQAGAEIFATAGSDAKRDYLRSLGVRHVFSSRTTDFAREIRSITNGAGVDVVLNSLAGEFIDAGFQALADGGRFVEIGKRDIRTEEQVAALGKGYKYHAVDLIPILKFEPGLIRSHLHQLVEQFGNLSASLRPLPFTIFEFDQAPVGFRYMTQARHMGKVLFHHSLQPGVRADGTYLITGGLGAIGTRLARWLGQRGARHLMLVGRHAPAAPVQALEELRAAGLSISVLQADVSNRDQVRSVLDHIRDRMPPLAGVFHAAGVVDDGPLIQQTPDRMRAVMAPKVAGAWNLHELTAGQPLDWFVLFSSVASLTGSPGQSSYAAGNAFLDALAHHRTARGLAALSVNWGAWAESGMAARTSQRGRRSLEAIQAMPPDECIECLEKAMLHPTAQIAIVDAQWAQWKEAPRILADLVERPSSSAPGTTRSLSELLESVPQGQRKRALLEVLREHS
ncbi:MAG: SDR family NAD(P)-dependent oxidoreductase, partial [Bryobacteraceae bacterium]